MAAYAALVSLINTIHHITNHPRISTFFDTKHFQSLLGNAGLLLDSVEANNYGAGTKEAKDLEREISFAAQEAEAVLDFLIMDQVHAESSEASLRCTLELQQKIQDMDVVVKKANEFKANQGSIEEEQEQPPPVMEIGETAMVGLDAELIHLLDTLTREPKSSQRTISIVGMGGTGKTTLARNIYENKLIKYHFDILTWATISQKHNAQGILSQLVYGQGKSSNETVDELGLQLHQKLFCIRYLIVLDDIWSVKAWDEVKRFFPNNQNGSRIVLTTRLSSVANDCGSAPFMMRFLDEDSSWKLFSEKVFKNKACPEELWEVGEVIVKSCKGLALSIVVMGGLLSKSPRTIEYWKGVAKDMKSISEKQESLDVLSLSYRHLPAHLKPCFLYMGTFKEDSEIIVSSVIRLWVAEGFIKPNGTQDLEEIGEGLLKDLIDRNLILVGRLRKKGTIASCGIHDLLRDLCIKLGKQHEFFHTTDYCIQGTEHRLVCESLDCEVHQIPVARSIRTEYLSGKLNKQGLLRVLIVESETESPAELYGNVNLSYLAYFKPRNVNSELPASLSFLWNLQTLIILHLPDDLVVAPPEIWKMRKLRHLVCDKIYLRPHKGQDRLESLQTLKRAFNLKMSTEVCKSIPNIKKLYLRYNYGLQPYDDSWVEHLCNLERLNKLESLELICCPKLTISCSKLAFPNSLNKLSLSFCDLHWDDLRMIGSLPQLEVLILGFDSVSKGERWSPIGGQFLRLKFLKIESSPLEYWDADRSHFPVLEKLVLVFMDYLKEIPLGIGDIPTLELVSMYYCTVSAAISAVKIKEDQLDNGNDTIQIQLSIDKSDLEDFKESVESNGLSVSNIQLKIF